MALLDITPRSGDKGGDTVELKPCPFDTVELKPCLFCGSAAKMVKDGTSSYKIFCTSIYCDAQMGWCNDDDLLADEWSRRVNDG